MVAVKEMPYAEKYRRVLGGQKHDEYVATFIEERLGREAAEECQRLVDSGQEPVPEDASFRDKYEIAYKNWMWEAGVIFRFIRERMGEAGLDEMVAVGAEGLKRENSGASLYLLALIRAFSPGRAFEMVAKQSAYEFQWLTPYSVDELSRDRVVMSIPHCKILDYPDCEDACLYGCQKEYPRWMAEQLKVKLSFDRQGTSCVATVTPLH
jgi:hypothetical protein